MRNPRREDGSRGTRRIAKSGNAEGLALPLEIRERLEFFVKTVGDDGADFCGFLEPGLVVLVGAGF